MRLPLSNLTGAGKTGSDEGLWLRWLVAHWASRREACDVRHSLHLFMFKVFYYYYYLCLLLLHLEADKCGGKKLAQVQFYQRWALICTVKSSGFRADGLFWAVLHYVLFIAQVTDVVLYTVSVLQYNLFYSYTKASVQSCDLVPGYPLQLSETFNISVSLYSSPGSHKACPTNLNYHLGTP